MPSKDNKTSDVDFSRLSIDGMDVQKYVNNVGEDNIELIKHTPQQDNRLERNNYEQILKTIQEYNLPKLNSDFQESLDCSCLEDKVNTCKSIVAEISREESCEHDENIHKLLNTVVMNARIESGSIYNKPVALNENKSKAKIAQVTAEGSNKPEEIELIAQENYDKTKEQQIKLQDKFDVFCQVLKSRFSPEEQTYARYLNSTQKLYDIVQSNFTQYRILLNSISAVNAKEIKKKLSDAGLAESLKSTLEDRLEIYHQAQHSMEAILVVNEQVMTTITELTIKLSLVETGQNLEEKAENAIAETQVLIDRVKLFGK